MTEVTSLRDETRRMLAKRPADLTYKQIETETGIKVSWLQNFALSKSEHPSVVWVETLNVYLKKLKYGK